MLDYSAPIEEFDFILRHVIDFDQTMINLGMEEIDTDLVARVLDEGGKFCARRLQPINREGDKIGSRLVNGSVHTPPGFPEAYADFVSDGWASLSAEEDHGGQGLPFVVQLLFDEMMSATNLAFGLFPGLTRGAIEAIQESGSAEIKETYLPPLVSGEWTGVMALTEASAGTDLGLLQTRAIPCDDGTYEITGTKIFISSGDHDFGGNIIHLVLARLPDAPAGVKGISLFLVPKLLADGDGAFTIRNSLSVGALEDKMGIHAQPTCLINYDSATGLLIGEPHRGLAAMFVMMNAERLFVGIQGLGVASAAYHQAVAYARERLQGKGSREHGPVAIIEHPDVRRMLLDVRAFVEAGRALAAWVALEADIAKHHEDKDRRKEATGFVALLTPVVKAAFTDMGFESAVVAQQVFGGHGYIREWGMEQFVRDARITQIYEGTNGVQALDLVSRKICTDGGLMAARYFDRIGHDVERASRSGFDPKIVEPMVATLARIREATSFVLDAEEPDRGAIAKAYLSAFAMVSLGWMWLRMAEAAFHLGPEARETKFGIARFYCERMSPRVSALLAEIKAGSASIMVFKESAF